MASPYGGLVFGKCGFDYGPEEGSDRRAEQSPNSGWELKGAALPRRGRNVFLWDPNKEVHAGTEHTGEGLGLQIRSVPPLRQDRGSKSGCLLESFVRDTIGAGSTAPGCQNEPEKFAFKGTGLLWEDRKVPPGEVVVEEAVSRGRPGGAGGPQRASRLPEHAEKGAGPRLPTAVTPA